MNVLGLKITVEPTPSSRSRWARRAVALGAINVAVLASGTAYAFWATTGSGSGVAKAGTASPLTTVTATAAVTGLLYPNGPAGDLTVTFRNPNTFPVKITNLSGNGTVTAAGGTGTCTTTGVAVTAQSGLALIVPAKSGGTDGSLTSTLTGAVSMDNTSQDGCQNATFTVPVTFSGTSN
ncbi:MAG: hypothetical protein QOK42_2072 [Frankiaceae bacterium]|nr:hypothetical protein [Frankiaceae bacterium]